MTCAIEDFGSDGRTRSAPLPSLWRPRATFVGREESAWKDLGTDQLYGVRERKRRRDEGAQESPRHPPVAGDGGFRGFLLAKFAVDAKLTLITFLEAIVEDLLLDRGVIRSLER